MESPNSGLTPSKPRIKISLCSPLPSFSPSFSSVVTLLICLGLYDKQFCCISSFPSSKNSKPTSITFAVLKIKEKRGNKKKLEKKTIKEENCSNTVISGYFQKHFSSFC
jgi:hypothetical protein